MHKTSSIPYLLNSQLEAEMEVEKERRKEKESSVSEDVNYSNGAQCTCLMPVSSQ